MRISDWSSDVCSSDLEPDNERGSHGVCGSHRERQCAHAVVIARQQHGVAFDDLGEMRDLGAIGLRITIEEEILERCARCAVLAPGLDRVFVDVARADEAPRRSEEHTSELQSLMRISYAVVCLNKKKIHT